ncbi:peptidase domain-containing ABC transporter [Hyphomicrobium sp. CS1BSMeth3]|uniref:peptidase domain-containing ABC transporter n=1 Tax=Hyphomicrobium sp. CS1BSMeth3 TaxID=1892844 RepID=UPI0009316837|nr:peptidase domain-containing ABC transporter [Hyphomicrobium sp. CS1BSMeth3]
MSILDELHFGGRRLPVITASEAAECGLACIAMISRYHGHDVDLNGLRQRYALSLAGASLKSLMEITDKLGFSTRALRVELGALDKVRLPAIVHWDLNHFVVLKSVGRRKLVVHDPALGVRVFSPEEFSKHFTGVVLELARAETFEPVSARMPMKLSMLWSRMTGWWPALAQVLVLSVALQIVTFVAPLQMQLVVDEALASVDRDLLTVIALGFGALVIIQAAIEALRSWALRVFGHLLSFQISGNLVRHLLRLPSDYFEKRHAGDIISRLGSTKPIQDAITQGVVGTVIDGIMACVAAVILFFYSTTLAMIVIAAVLINMALNLALFPRMKQRMEEEILAEAKEQTHLMESVRAATTLKLLGREAVRESGWRNLHADSTNASIAVGKLTISQSLIQSIVTGLQTVIVIYVAGRLILDGQGFSVGMLFSFLSYRQTFTDRANALVNQLMQFRFLRLHLDRLADIVTTPTELSGASSEPAEVRGHVRLKDVSFRYGATDPLVLEDINLEISPGDYVAIHGASGGGKSTLLKLLLGLNQPSDGMIELDGQRATAERWRAWREKVGVVAQDDRLLSGTLADNIGGFDPDLDMQRVVAAAVAAQVHNDIVRMPMQYLTLVGDMGSTLSGGQRQRVLLARALYRQPKILILDEGTANLDEQNEELIADLIDQMPITRIVVAHRPALLRRAKRVYEVGGRRLKEVQYGSGHSPLAAAVAAP